MSYTCWGGKTMMDMFYIGSWGYAVHSLMMYAAILAQATQVGGLGSGGWGKGKKGDGKNVKRTFAAAEGRGSTGPIWPQMVPLGPYGSSSIIIIIIIVVIIIIIIIIIIIVIITIISRSIGGVTGWPSSLCCFSQGHRACGLLR